MGLGLKPQPDSDRSGRVREGLLVGNWEDWSGGEGRGWDPSWLEHFHLTNFLHPPI